jgi:hypothetical protein
MYIMGRRGRSSSDFGIFKGAVDSHLRFGREFQKIKSAATVAAGV